MRRAPSKRRCRISRSQLTMADEDKLDKVLTHLDSIHSMCDSFKTRLDAMEEEHKKDRADAAEWKARADAAEKERADKARADAEEKERKEKEEKEKADAEAKARADAEEKEKADKARKDAEEKEKADAAARASGNTDLAKKLAEIERRLPATLADADKAAFAEAQMRADAAYSAWNLGPAPHALNGETLSDYRVRLLSKVKQHSKLYKDSNLGALAVADSAAFSVVENAIVNDAVEASCSNITVGAPLRMQESKTESGHIVRKFVGDAAVTWAPFMGGATKFGRITRPKSH